MKKSVFLFLAVLLMITLLFVACDGKKDPQPPAESTQGTTVPEPDTEGTTAPETEAHIHAFGDWAKVKDATCTENGEQQRTCDCGEVETQRFDALGHTEAVDAAVAPTCTETGLTEGKHCSVCNEVLVAQEVVAALGHTEVIDAAVEPTCTATGLTEGKHCSVCNEVLVAQEVVDALGHTEVIDEAVVPTCTATGLTAGSHCSACNEVLVAQETVDALGHTEVIDEAVVPTCTATGLTAGSHCSACNEVLVAQETVDALGHTEVIDEAVVPTCTATGLTAGSHCSACNEVLVAQETVDALGHTEVIDEAVVPTCTATGLTAGSRCSVCKEVLVAQEEVAALGHTEVVDAAVAPTCTATGLTEGKHCSVCKEVLVAQEEVAALGHTEVIDAAVAPTCIEDGLTEGLHCATCNEFFVAQETVAALGHTEVIDEAIPATYGNAGLTTGSHCSVCGEVLVAQIALPALWNEDKSDIVVNNQHYNEKDDVTYYYFYNLDISDSNNTFVLTTVIRGTDASCTIEQDTGALIPMGLDVYMLSFDSQKDPLYIRLGVSSFQFVDADDSNFDEVVSRFEGTTDIDITPRDGHSSYGYYDLANNEHGEAMQALYREMMKACEAFSSYDADVVSNDGEYIIATIDLHDYVITPSEVVAVWKVFYHENPGYYWLSNSLTLTRGEALNLCIDPAYANVSYRLECDQAIAEMVKALDTEFSIDMSELERALLIHDFIINRMNYAYEDDGVTPQDDIWAHNMIGCAKYYSGVCESYSKTFMYLCLLNDLECLVVVGDAGERHAWNLISIDGVWYGVDCTWDDTVETVDLYDCFGMASEYLESTHMADLPNGRGANYWYELPEVSQRSLELVDLYESEVLVGTYGNIDLAFAAMQNSDSDYTIILYFYAYQRDWLFGIYGSPNIIHGIYSENAPKCKSLTVVGDKVDLDSNGSFSSRRIIIYGDFFLQSDLIIHDTIIDGYWIDIECEGEITRYNGQIVRSMIGSMVGEGYYDLILENGNLITKGYYCQLNTDVVGKVENDDNCAAIVVNTDYETEIYGTVQVYSLIALTGGDTI